MLTPTPLPPSLPLSLPSFVPSFQRKEEALYYLNHTYSPFALVILEMRSLELFAEARLKPRSS
jgi:hypothetical protein